MEFSELSTNEKRALILLNRYGSAEDCRSGLEEVVAFELLAGKGLVKRRQDETWITDAGRKLLQEGGDSHATDT